MNAINLNTTVNPIESNNPQNEFFKISFQVRGIKKRCRKSDRHFIQLGSIPYNQGEYNKEDIISKVRDSLAVNIKEVHSIVRIHLDHVIIKNEGTFTSTQWEPFSDKNIVFEIQA
jgi:hypothetical protein